MELLPTITNLLLAAGAFFLIVLIASFVISKFRKEKEIVTESYPAQKYQYFTNSASNIQQPNFISEYYNITGNPPLEIENTIGGRNEQPPFVYINTENDETINHFNEHESFQNNWVDFDNEQMFENPLRKTSSFNVYSENSINEKFNGRMMIINESPVFKYGWE